jgi:hypothetical protein
MEFKKHAKIKTDDFFYDLFLGGYIKPKDILVNDVDIQSVENAISVIREFYDYADEANIIEDY